MHDHPTATRLRMAMAWTGQLAAHALHPVQRSGSCGTANFFQRTTSRLRRCGSQTALHRPQPVQRWVSMSGSRCDLRGACASMAPIEVPTHVALVWKV
jgi:hypothetical protein